MSYETRSPGHDANAHGAGEPAVHPATSPGKQTLTEALEPPHAAASATVQRKATSPGPAAVHQFRLDLFAGQEARPPIQGHGLDAEAEPGPDALPASGSGARMPEAVQAKMERALGSDFSAVRIHEGPRAEALGAQAYTQGSDIHFAPGRYDPHGAQGQELLGHELTHVVQQSQGRVQATTQAKGLPVNDDPGLEQEADEQGARAARGEAVDAAGGARAPAMPDTLQSGFEHLGRMDRTDVKAAHAGDASAGAPGPGGAEARPSLQAKGQALSGGEDAAFPVMQGKFTYPRGDKKQRESHETRIAAKLGGDEKVAETVLRFLMGRCDKAADAREIIDGMTGAELLRIANAEPLFRACKKLADFRVILDREAGLEVDGLITQVETAETAATTEDAEAAKAVAAANADFATTPHAIYAGEADQEAKDKKTVADDARKKGTGGWQERVREAEAAARAAKEAADEAKATLAGQAREKALKAKAYAERALSSAQEALVDARKAKAPPAVQKATEALAVAKKAQAAAEEARQTADAGKTEAHKATHLHKDYTAAQIVTAAGYKGTTSVSYYGGKDIMIRKVGSVAGKPIHFTQFRENYDTKEYKSDTPIKTAVDEVFGGVGAQSFHVTQELHGEKKPADNPHYFVTDRFSGGNPLTGSTAAKQPELKTALHDEIKRIYNVLANARRFE
jgi:hypothetical protein